MINVDFKKLVKLIYTDDAQKGALDELARHRRKLEQNGTDDVSKTVLRYIKNGIHYIPKNSYMNEEHIAEIEYIAEQTGTDLNGYGVNEKNDFYFSDKYVIPVRDSKNRILFYITHTFDNPKSAKYVNVYTDNYDGKEVAFKVYGMHNTQLALKQNRMVVVEGVFDSNILPEFNIPAVALLGTKLVPYHKQYLSRFKSIIYIPDNDVAGETAWKRFKKEFPNAIQYNVPLGFKDAEEFIYGGKKEQVKIWIDNLYKLQNSLL